MTIAREAEKLNIKQQKIDIVKEVKNRIWDCKMPSTSLSK